MSKRIKEKCDSVYKTWCSEKCSECDAIDNFDTAWGKVLEEARYAA